jgi:hypothetical protein
MMKIISGENQMHKQQKKKMNLASNHFVLRSVLINTVLIDDEHTVDTTMKKRYAPIIREEEEVDMEILISTKTFNHLTWKQWTSMRKQDRKPIYRNRMMKKTRTLLAPIHASGLQFTAGAFLPLFTLCDQVYTLYKQFNAIGIHPKKKTSALDLIVSLDNRMLLGKNEAFHIRYYDVVDAQNSKHVHDFAIAVGKENNELLTSVAEEVELNQFCSSYPTHFLTQFGMDLNILYTSDWMAIVAELNCIRPNTSNIFDVVCWACAATRHDITIAWLKTPFALHELILEINDWPDATLHELPLEQRRYDWMHGVTNLLNNITHDLIAEVPRMKPGKKKEFQKVMRRCHTDWTLESSLRPTDMKTFFSRHLDIDIASLYDDEVLLDIKWPEEVEEFQLTTKKIVEMLLDAVRAYKDFAYTLHPTNEDFHVLWQARTVILSVYWVYGFPLKPTMHFMLNEALCLAWLDGTAYITLQEGAEHKNADDKEDKRNTMKKTVIDTTGESCWEQMLNTQQLRRVLTSHGYAPPDYTLFSIDNYLIVTDITPIHSVKHACTIIHPF